MSFSSRKCITFRSAFSSECCCFISLAIAPCHLHTQIVAFYICCCFILCFVTKLHGNGRLLVIYLYEWICEADRCTTVYLFYVSVRLLRLQKLKERLINFKMTHENMIIFQRSCTLTLSHTHMHTCTLYTSIYT